MSEILLNSEKILVQLPAHFIAHKQLEIHQSLGSTNDYAKQQKDRATPFFCLAEQQTAGRGRMGRSWVSPFAQNIYFTACYDLACDLKQLAGLSLACGLAVLRAILPIDQMGDRNGMLQLKWPNDIMLSGKKCGGLLVETVIINQNKIRVIIGVGLNVNMLPNKDIPIDRPWISLQTLTQEPMDRNPIVSRLILELTNTVNEFIRTGFTPLVEEWQTHDLLMGKEITLTQHNQRLSGTMIGVDLQGNLLLKTKDKVIPCSVGDTSLCINNSIS